MDRLSFLKRIAEQHVGDAELFYWLAEEYVERELWVEAIGQYSAGLAVCTVDELRSALLVGLNGASTNLQQGGLRTEQAKIAVNVQQVEDVNTISDDEFGHSEMIDKDNNIDKNSIPSASIADSSVTYASSPIGLQVLDGGKIPNTSRPNNQKEITFTDVSGLKDLKKAIQLRIISPFQNQGLFSKFRKKAGGGVLLYGPPGCGKTFIAKATAGECQATFIPVHITDILDKYIGVSEQNLKDMFDKARGLKPSIMFFDEIDTVGFSRSKSSSHMRGLIDTFLTEMEGIDTSTDQVLVIGATNMPWDVDDALKRPGRFDRLIFVGPPDEVAREHMFRLKLAGRYAESIDTHTLAKRTEFFSGADIENLCERTAEHVLGEILETGIERPMRMSDFEVLLQEVRPSTLEWLHKAKNYVKYANHSGVYNEVEDYLRKNGRRI